MVLSHCLQQNKYNTIDIIISMNIVTPPAAWGRGLPQGRCRHTAMPQRHCHAARLPRSVPATTQTFTGRRSRPPIERMPPATPAYATFVELLLLMLLASCYGCHAYILRQGWFTYVASAAIHVALRRVAALIYVAEDTLADISCWRVALPLPARHYAVAAVDGCRVIIRRLLLR